MKGLIQRCLKRVGRWVAGPVAVLAGLGAHGMTTLIVLGAFVIALAVLACLMWRWALSGPHGFGGPGQASARGRSSPPLAPHDAGILTA